MTRIMIALIVLFSAAPAAAQTPVKRGAHWPDAAGIVQMVLAGERGVAVSTALRTCPQLSPYGDTVWVALLAAPRTPELTYRLATSWGGALRSCGDPRIEAWYHSRLSEATDLLSAYPIVSAMLRHGASESVAALKHIAFDETRDEELRSAILQGMAEDWDRRIDTYLEAVAETKRLPEPYGQNEWAALSSSPVVAAFTLRALDVIQSSPGHNAASLLMRLAALDGTRTTPYLRARLDAVTQAILSAPPQQYPRVLRDAAAAAKESLARGGSSAVISIMSRRGGCAACTPTRRCDSDRCSRRMAATARLTTSTKA